MLLSFYLLFAFSLTSPSGTPTVLLFERPRDVLEPSFEDWPFMSVHFWGERAAGRWKLEIINAGNKRVSKAGRSEFPHRQVDMLHAKYSFAK